MEQNGEVAASPDDVVSDRISSSNQEPAGLQRIISGNSLAGEKRGRPLGCCKEKKKMTRIGELGQVLLRQRSGKQGETGVFIQ